jgi:hypothetical protein
MENPMNLLDLFALKHAQVTLLHAEMTRTGTAGEHGHGEAKIEFNMKPQILKAEDEATLPSYQVSSRLKVKSGDHEKPAPEFNARIAIEAVYQQATGEPMDLATFRNHTATLARQLYPLLHLELRGLLARLGISGVRLPLDLSPGMEQTESKKDSPPTSVH